MIDLADKLMRAVYTLLGRPAREHCHLFEIQKSAPCVGKFDKRGR